MGNLVQAVTHWLRETDERLSQHGWYRVTRNAYLGFNRRDGSRKAAAMTYFAVFSIFPFLLLLMGLLAFFIDPESAQERVTSALSGFLPSGSSAVQNVIEGVIAARGVATGIGLVFLLWGALGWFGNIDRSVNEMWAAAGRRSLIKGNLFALTMIFGIALVMLLSWLMNIAVDVAKGFASPLFNLPGSAAVWHLMAGAVALALMFLAFLLLYRYSPMCQVQWREIWRGALVTAFIWEVVRSGFAIYVTHFANFASAYGPLGAAIAFLFWLYVAHTIILFGAALTYAIRLDSRGLFEFADFPCATEERRSSQTEEEQKGRPAA